MLPAPGYTPVKQKIRIFSGLCKAVAEAILGSRPSFRSESTRSTRSSSSRFDGNRPMPQAHLLELLRPLTSVGGPIVTTQSLSFIEAARHFAGDGDKQRVYFKAKSDYAVEPLNSQGIGA